MYVLINAGKNTRRAYLRRIQAYALATHEAALYLDTHPTSREALVYFKRARAKLSALTEEYERRFGPLTAFSSNAEKYWDWVTGPWPWQNDDMKGEL